MVTDRVFIIGNGTSRKDYDLENLREHKTIGCNAIVRDWDPNYVTAIDGKITEEIVNDCLIENKRTELLVPPWHWHFELDRNQNDHARRNNAGMVAMKLAIERFGMRELFLLGFDGFYNQNGDMTKLSDNIYAGTKCYIGVLTRMELMYRRQYMEYYITDLYPYVKFVFVAPPSLRLDISFRKHASVAEIDYNDLQSILEIEHADVSV